MSQKRNQTLPKSLAGRLTKGALTWGTVYAAERHAKLRDKLSSFGSPQPHHSDQNKQVYHAHSIFQAYNEMTSLATTVGHLLLLDRFRPMLLPRHLNDVYLILLIAERSRWYLSKLDRVSLDIDDQAFTKLMQKEKMAEAQNCQRLHSLQQALMFSPLAFPSSLISEAPKALPPSKTVDGREAALAYRNLLGGGASMLIPGASRPATPQWLRLRLGQCLTRLAQDNLQSVTEVFVAHARGHGGDAGGSNAIDDDVMTGAAARLAQALCAKPSSPNSCSSFKEQLCAQFVDFLVAEDAAYVNELTSNTGNAMPPQSRPSIAMHLTLWATIALISGDDLLTFFIPRLTSGLIQYEGHASEPRSDSLTTRQSISAICAWLSSIPASLDPSTARKIHSLLLQPCASVQGRPPVTMMSQVLRLAASLSHQSGKTSSNTFIMEVNGTGEVDGERRLLQITLAQMIHTLINASDCKATSNKNQFTTIALGLLKATTDIESDESVRDHSPTEAALSHLVEGLEMRAKCLVDSILSLTALNGDANEAKETSDDPVHLLLSSLFQVVLLLHYSKSAGSSCLHHSPAYSLEVEKLLQSSNDELKMTSSILLATLCESCPPATLLSGNGAGILEILRLIIDSAAVEVGEERAANADSEELLSTTSIVLSLLVALLELGSGKRSDAEESLLVSVLPSLRTLSVGNKHLAPELAEMASHAMALIAARGAIEGPNDVLTPLVASEKTGLEALVAKLSQAECDLQSTQPPIRARGVVSLRHIARSLVNEDSNRDEGPFILDLALAHEEKTDMITELNESLPVPESNLSKREQLGLLSRSLAKICVDALADHESYVYLASIQTLVAISDVSPSEIMPLMGRAIATGQLNIDVASVDTTSASVELSLTPEQRIKATEALIFMIRRRGDGIFLYGPALLQLMLYGVNNKQRKDDEPILRDGDQIQQLIQGQTHSYFTGETLEDDDAEEKKMRLNTGGPVFFTEETDVLRAGSISVVCELVSVLNPMSVSKHCNTLVRLASDAMQLESSRPVRRAAASLARELYACTLREVTTPDQENGKSSTSTLAVAMANANEEKLFNSLKRCISADEIAVNASHRLADPATQSRSAEAIEIRLELDAMGVLQAAALIATSMERESRDTTVQAVRRALSN